MFDFGYEKNDNNSLFNQIKDSNLINMGTVQNYIPLYTKFFDINQSNYNSFNIRQRYILSSIENRINEHVYSIKIMEIYLDLVIGKKLHQVIYFHIDFLGIYLKVNRKVNGKVIIK